MTESCRRDGTTVFAAGVLVHVPLIGCKLSGRRSVVARPHLVAAAHMHGPPQDRASARDGLPVVERMSERNQSPESPTRRSKVLALSVSKGIARFIGLLTMMAMARVLTKEDLAAYRQTLLAYAIAAPILELGIGQGLYYFLPAEKIRIRGRVLDAVTVLGAMGTLFARVWISLGAGLPGQ